MAFREELKLFLNILSNSKKIKSDGIFAGAKRQSWQANGASAQLMFPWKIVLMLTGDAERVLIFDLNYCDVANCMVSNS